MDLKTILPLLTAKNAGNSFLGGDTAELLTKLKSGDKSDATAALISAMNNRKKHNREGYTLLKKIASPEILGAIIKYNAQ